MRSTAVCLLAIAALLLLPLPAAAHCQIPCGIYGDMLRVKLMQEHIATIEKSMKEIDRLAASDAKEKANQLPRWVMNKEEHAQKLQQMVLDYWLSQRIKMPKAGDEAAREKYLRQLELLHRIIVFAMKAKQGTDLGHVEQLRKLVQEFAESYFGPEELKHLKEHH